VGVYFEVVKPEGMKLWPILANLRSGAHVNIYGVHHTKTVRKVGVKATHSPRRDSGLRRPLGVISRHVSKAQATAREAVGPAAPAATKFAATVPLSHCSRPENFGMFFLYLNPPWGRGRARKSPKETCLFAS
jgi:hypothetical protein